jgi:hypothetical protein
MDLKKEIKLINVSSLTGESKYIYNKIKMFYDEFSRNNQNDMKIIIDIINSKYKIPLNTVDGIKMYKLSLRFLDEFITRYCSYYKVIIPVNTRYIRNDIFNIYIQYQARLKSHHKDYFDPFKRIKECEKFEFETNGFKFITTLCQLNFFQWVIENDILKYIERNIDLIVHNKKEVDEYFKNKKNKKDTSSTTSTHSLSSENRTKISFVLEL